jgi:hypothetical protein
MSGQGPFLESEEIGSAPGPFLESEGLEDNAEEMAIDLARLAWETKVEEISVLNVAQQTSFCRCVHQLYFQCPDTAAIPFSYNMKCSLSACTQHVSCCCISCSMEQCCSCCNSLLAHEG